MGSGVSMSSLDEEDNTALWVVVRTGHDKCVDVLLKAGVDVNIFQRNTTALIHAAEHGYVECLNLLIKAGADVNAGDINNLTALSMAAQHGNGECIRSLIQAGADVNSTDCCENTSLMYAVRSCHIKYVDLLIEAGADVNRADDLGLTPLMEAVHRDHFDKVTSLIKTGADVNAATLKTRKSVLCKAAISNNVKCVKLLLKSGSKVNVLDNDSCNALQYYIAHYSLLDVISLDRTMVLLLLAAGETIGATTVNCTVVDKEVQYDVPRFLINRLKHLCRKAIRNHLFDVDPHENLFGRIPYLGFPRSLIEYMLFHVTLDE